MDIKLMVLNSIILSVTHYFVTAQFIHEKARTKWLYFWFLVFVSTVFNLFLPRYSVIVIYVFSAIGFILINRNLKNTLSSVNITLSIIVYFQTAIMLIGSLLLLIFPNESTRYMMFYNLIVQIWILGVSFFLIKSKDYFFSENKSQKLLVFDIGFKMWFMLTINVLLPLLFKQYGKLYHTISLLFVLISCGFMLYMKYVVMLENNVMKNTANAEMLDTKAKNIQSKYEEIIKLKHYYYSLYKSLLVFIQNNDMQGLKKYFNRYITPINEDLKQHESDYAQIDCVKITIIRTLLLELINTVSSMPNVSLNIGIEGEIKKLSMHDIDIFKVLTIFIQNAVEETAKQEQGYICIIMMDKDNMFTFMIENSINITSTGKPFNTHKGLEIVKEILSANTNVNLQTTTESNVFIQLLEVTNY